MVVIVDAGLGNVASVLNMLKYLGVPARLLGTPEGTTPADRFILPGVGAFDEGVHRLQDSGWYEHLKALPESSHILGICLGMQLLGRSSEEGIESGLGRIDAHFERFKVAGIRVPHMGWNHVESIGKDPIFGVQPSPDRFYFTHSFRAVCVDSSSEIARTLHGEWFTSAYRSGNTRGVQFHPEKSHKYGMGLLRRWVALPC